MAEMTTSAAGDAPRGIPEQLAPGLDLFAAAWLESYVKAGGDVCVFPDGKSQVGWRPYRGGPTYQEPSASLPEEVREASITFSDGRHNGMITGLLDLLESVPHGRDAVKAHLKAHGITYMSASQPVQA